MNSEALGGGSRHMLVRAPGCQAAPTINRVRAQLFFSDGRSLRSRHQRATKEKHMALRFFGAAAVLTWVCTCGALGQTPLGTTFTYQGQLKQNGQLFNGTANLVFRLFAADTGGTPLGSQTLPGTPITAGQFTVQLNGDGQFGVNAFSGEKRWLEIEVDGTPLAPRQPVTATPYAQFSLNADRLDGLDSAAFLQAVPNPLVLTGSQSGSSIISGTNTSAGPGTVGVLGSCTANSALLFAGRFENSSTNGIGVFAYATAPTGVTYGRSSTTTASRAWAWERAAAGLTACTPSARSPLVRHGAASSRPTARPASGSSGGRRPRRGQPSEVRSCPTAPAGTASRLRARDRMAWMRNPPSPRARRTAETSRH